MKRQLIFILTFIIIIYTSFKIGYIKGVNIGYSVSLDTISKIMDRQVKNDTIVTKLTLEDKDTLTYYLSKKKIFDEK